MKHLYKIGIFAAVLITLNTCAESGLLDYDFEIPESVAIQEELNDYDVLNEYVDYNINPNFLLGASVDMSSYSQRGLLYRLVNSNFNQLTFNRGMQHGDIVQANGSLLMTNLNNSLTLAKESDLSVLGNSLVWNKNQNATYLNGLLSPLTVGIKAYSNLLDKTSLGSNSLNGWTINSSTGAAAVVDGKGLNGGKAISLISGSTSSAATDIQLITPNIPIIQGHEYEVIMYIKSEVEGEGRITFSGLEDNTPSLDWTGTGMVKPTFSTSFVWKEVKFRIKDFTSNSINLHLDFGYKPNVTYYIDTTTLYVRDMADNGDSGGGNNTLVTGDKLWFEAECGKIGNGGKWDVYDDANASEGKYVMVKLATQNNNPATTPVSDLITYNFEVNSSGTFTLFARVGAAVSTSNDDSFYFKIDNGAWYTFNAVMNTTALRWYRMTTANLEPGTTHTITVCYREDGAKLDKLYITNGTDVPSVPADNKGGVAGNCGGVIIVADKTAVEKTYIVDTELTKWISGVVSNSKEVVKAWNVLNDPMDDANPSQVKTGAGVSDATQFFWQDYLGGKDYGVKAFNLAKANANPTDLLFISDYGLEKNLNKCTGLIQYVQYLEANGAQVDGISVKLNLNLSSDKDKIYTMFELLAATGKKIAVSDLYVSTMTGNPTEEMNQLQADMYRYVVESYALIIPISQRYGITLKGIQDISNDSQGLWDSTLNINRKPAYASFVEGLKSLK